MKILVALYDRATEAYAPPMMVHTRGEAIRSFKQAVNDNNTSISQHPTDFELCQIGTYNEQTGELVPQPIERIARGEDYKE